MSAVAVVFGEQMIRQGLWPAWSPDFNTHNLYSWVTLKHQASVEYLQSLRKLQKVHSAVTFFFSRNKFCLCLEPFLADEMQKVEAGRRLETPL